MATILRKHRTVFNLSDMFRWLQLPSSVRNKVQIWAMSTLYRTAYHVDLKTTPPGVNGTGPDLEKVIRTVQQIILERLAKEGVVLKILFTLVQRFIFAHFQHGGFQGFFP